MSSDSDRSQKPPGEGSATSDESTTVAAPLEFHTPGPETRALAEHKIEKIGVRVGSSHFFLCAGPDCCNTDFGMTVWSYLKRRTKELEPELEGTRLLRTRVQCLRICQSLGPTMVVYPSGNWYHGINEANCERVLQFELFGRGEIEDLKLARSGEAL